MRTSKRTWIWAGLTGAAVMSLIGPRPVFVKTAYAEPAFTEAQQITTSFQTIDCEGLDFTTVARDSYDMIVVEACD